MTTPAAPILQLEPARLEHSAAIASLLHGERSPESLRDFEERWRTFAARPSLSGRIFVATVASELQGIGWSQLELSRGRESLQFSIFVGRPWRRRGIGSQLLARVCGQAQGAAGVTCEIAANARVAKAFLTAHGFSGSASLARMQRELQECPQPVQPAGVFLRRAREDQDWRNWIALRAAIFGHGLHLHHLSLEGARALAEERGFALHLGLRDDGQCIGYAQSSTCESSRGMGLIVELAVAAAARGRGLGTALLQQKLTLFAEQGLAQAELYVELQAERNQRLYQRLGFQRVATFECWRRDLGGSEHE